MRGQESRCDQLFSYISPEQRIPANHPLRLIREIVDDVLSEMSGNFNPVYSGTGRPSIPPEQLLRALLLQAFFSIRSERQLMEHLEFNLLYRWFVGLNPDDKVWDASVFAKNRDRLLEAEIAHELLSRIVNHRRVSKLLSKEHFSVDGTQIEAWASMKSFQPRDGHDTGDHDADSDGTAGKDGGKDGGKDSGDPRQGRNSERNFHNEKRSNATHVSTTDPEARLLRKGYGKESRLSYLGHALMENRCGLVVDGRLTQATGTAEREAALAMLDSCKPGSKRATLGGDKNFDVHDFVTSLRARNTTPHIARNTYRTKTGKRRKSAIDGRTTRHPGYAISQRIRKRVEEVFGWTKTNAGMRKVAFCGRKRVEGAFLLSLSAYNLIRLPKLLEAQA